MPRALRLQRPGGRYHVTARGNERKAIFRDDTDHFHFLELLGSAQFAQQLRREARGNPREQKALRVAPRGASWPQIVSALEKAKGQSWQDFAEPQGDWGRDVGLRYPPAHRSMGKRVDAPTPALPMLTLKATRPSLISTPTSPTS